LEELKKVLPNASLVEALQWLESETERTRSGNVPDPERRMHFADYATELFELKVEKKEIRSKSGEDKWKYILIHLIDGTRNENDDLLVEGFGEYLIDEIRPIHIEKWKANVVQRLIVPGLYSPTTANGWLSVLKVILSTATRDFDLARDPTRNVRAFDTSEHVTYSDDSPNSLTPDEVRAFLATMRGMYPQHFAMVALALWTGLRPSSLRPLRRSGPDADIRWETGELLIRRSQTRGEVMNRTKTGVRQRIKLPDEAVDVLRWHVETQLVTAAQKKSDLLFPSVTGGFRSQSVLNRPFADVAREIGLAKTFTVRGCRRTFNDLSRAAGVEALVTRSISGHLTEQMQHHYSTVQGDEQCAALAKVIELTAAKVGKGRKASGG